MTTTNTRAPHAGSLGSGLTPPQPAARRGASPLTARGEVVTAVAAGAWRCWLGIALLSQHRLELGVSRGG